MLLQGFLERSAAAQPDKTALVCGSQRISYAELEAGANRLAHGLRSAGVGRGDRVAFCLDNSIEAVTAVFGILKADGVFMPVNPTTKADKLAYVLNNSRASALILPAAKVSGMHAVWAATPQLRSIVTVGGNGTEALGKRVSAWADLLGRCAADAGPPPARNIDIDLAALIYTSGSTGNPKGVMLTHRNMTAAAESITTYLENRPDDIILNVLPLSFDYGLYQALMAVKIGGTLVLEKSFTYPQAVLEKVVAERVTGLPLVPTMAAILLQIDLSRHDLSHLRYVTNTAAALPVDHILRLRNLLPGVRLYSMYGLTECKRVSYLPPEQLDRRPGSVGRGMPNEEVFVVDDDGNRVGANVTGELVVRGANVMVGYWELPEESARRLRPGALPGERWLYTGDLFRTDDEGYLYFVGRKDDIIKSRGEKVAPREVEDVLHGHPGVAEAAVVGRPDAVLGQSICAYVTPRPGNLLDERELLLHCRRHLEDFMVPQNIVVQASLPRSPNGKIDRLLLAKVPA